MATKRGATARGATVRRSPALSHVDRQGRVRMVDVGEKAVTTRVAVARGSITMSAVAL